MRFLNIKWLLFFTLLFSLVSLTDAQKYKKSDFEVNPNGYLEYLTGAQRFIDGDHSNIHEGIFYSVNRDSIALANNAYIYFGIIVPDSSEVHFKSADIWVNGQYWIFELYEAPTFTNGTDTILSYNRYRRYGDSSNILFLKTPSSITLTSAKRIDRKLFGGGNGVGQATTSGNISLPIEWLLKANTKYLIRVQNVTGGAASISYNLYYYAYRRR